MAFVFLFIGLSVFGEEQASIRVFRSFESGRKLFLNKTPVGDCKKMSSMHSLFCEEGFALELFLSQKVEKIPTILSTIGSLSQRNIFAIAAGISMAMREKSPQELRSSGVINLYLLDGWGFGHFVFNKRPLAAVVKKCEKFLKADEKKICLYGLGRGVFFLKTRTQMMSETKNLSPDQSRWIQRGFGFASTFAGGEKPVNFLPEQVKKGMMIAEILVGFMKQPSAKPNAIATGIRCIEDGIHPAFCVR